MREIVPAVLAGERVDRAVAVLTELPRSTIAALIAEGAVALDAKPVSKPGVRVAEGQELRVDLPEGSSKLPVADDRVEFDVVYLDDDVIVVDKPAGLVVHPGAGHPAGTLVSGLLARFPDLAETVPGDPIRPGIVHRLDAGTSGLLVVARTQPAYEALVAAMKARRVDRRYLALVWGKVSPASGMIDAPIGRSSGDRTKMAVSEGGKAARTRYEVIGGRADPDVSLVSASLETGRTHQIRVHFAAIGHPVVGDRRYGGVRNGVEMSRPFLHATSLRFAHPRTGSEVVASSSLPDDLEAVLSHLGITDRGR